MSEADARRHEHAVFADQGDDEARASLHRARSREGWGQCDECGGSLAVMGLSLHAMGAPPCSVCRGLGCLPPGHPRIRLCWNSECKAALRPDHVAVYCTDQCAWNDA